MSQPDGPHFEGELRISHRPLLALILFAGVLVAVLARYTEHDSRLLNFVTVLWGLCIVTWLAETWHRQVGQWTLIVILNAIILLLHYWIDMPSALSLLAAVPMLATGMFGLYIGTGVAAAETLLLLVTWVYPPPRSDPSQALTALIVLWGVMVILHGIYRRVTELATWCWGHFEHAQRLLTEARNRQVELKQSIEALVHLNRQLALSNEKIAALRHIAEEAQRTKAAFVANVSHEFRTPLNVIIGLAQLMTETPYIYGEELPDALMEDLEILRRNCEHLSGMIDDVLDLSRVEAGHLNLYRERVDLVSVVDKALTVVGPLLERKGLWLHKHLPERLEVDCDCTRMRQVILNLVGNAARFTEQGGITVQMVPQDGNVVVSVSDTGPGISQDAIEHIFHPFYRVSDAGPQQGGSGLGLSITKQFIELHGGHLWVESVVGQGSTFAFRLPVAPLLDPLERVHGWLHEQWTERAPHAGRPQVPLHERVIVCDQETSPALCQLFARHLPDAEFVPAASVAAATHALQDCPAQLVVVNATNADQLAELLADARAAISDTPLMGCTLPPILQRATRSGAMGYLIKPIRREDLATALDSLDLPVRHVLVVEDNPDAMHLLTIMLNTIDEGLQITTATTGQQGLERMCGDRPDLVLLDIVLPDMDGWRLLEARNADEELREIPVLIISAQDPQETPPATELLQIAMSRKLSVSEVLRCGRQAARALLYPSEEPG